MDYLASRKKQVRFSRAIGNVELMHECFLKHLRMGTARMKQDKKLEEGKREVRKKIKKAESRPDDLLLLLLKKIGNARLGEGDCHPISPKTPAPHYQPIEEKKRKGK